MSAAIKIQNALLPAGRGTFAAKAAAPHCRPAGIRWACLAAPEGRGHETHSVPCAWLTCAASAADKLFYLESFSIILHFFTLCVYKLFSFGRVSCIAITYSALFINSAHIPLSKKWKDTCAYTDSSMSIFLNSVGFWLDDVSFKFKYLWDL